MDDVKILITGGAGYIGSRLIRDLARTPAARGALITIYDNMRDERYQSLMDLPPAGRYAFHPGDIEDAAELRRAAIDADIIIHLAALTNAVTSFDRVEATEATNHLGTANVVDAAVASPRTRRVIYASTCSVYGETDGVVDEDSECRPASPYGAFKLAGERSVLALGERTGGRVAGTALRLGTVYGRAPTFRVHTVVNIFAMRAALGMPLTVYGTGEARRPFLHVADASSAFVWALGDPRTEGRVLNVVAENRSVNDVIGLLAPRFPTLQVRNEPGTHLNQLSYQVDGSRLRALGWAPRYTIEDGIEEFASYCAAFTRRGALAGA